MKPEETSRQAVKSSKPSFTTPGRIAVLLAVWIGIALSIWGVYEASCNAVMREVRTRAQALATLVSNYISPADLQAIQGPEDIDSAEFVRVLQVLRNARDTNRDVRFAYVLSYEPGREPYPWQFIIDAQPFDLDLNADGVISAEEEGVKPGTPYPAAGKIPELRLALSRPTATKEFYSDYWGTFMSGYAPIRDPFTNRTVGVLGLDVPYDYIQARFQIVQGMSLVAFFIIFILANSALLALFGKAQALEVVRQLELRLREQNLELADKNMALQNTNRELKRSQKILSDELAIAQQVQKRFLPKSFPHRDRLRFASLYRACSSIGGDLFDAFPVGERLVGFYIADVSGHGVPAALVTAVFKVTMDRTRASIERALEKGGQEEHPTDVLLNSDILKNNMQELNRSMAEVLPPGGFVSFIFGLLCLKRGRLLFINAGHNPPIMWRQDTQSVEEFSVPSNLPIGIGMDMDYEVVTTEVKVGDKVMLYTDGLTEQMNAQMEELGIQQLLEVVRREGSHEAEDILEAVEKETARFGGEIPPHDDQAAIIIEYARDGISAHARNLSSVE
jgi:serine phosphatase RsbU (regulator of sigma subunit)